MSEHIPVLLAETIDGLDIQADGIYIDATFGRGGHSRAILQRLNEQGRVIAIDRDPSAIIAAQSLSDERLKIFHVPFSELLTIAKQENVLGKVDGILLDLGVSSPQLDEQGRGFSFTREGPLDMRMDTSCGETAAQWLSKVSEKDLTDVLFNYGEERFAKRIARAIIAAREEAPLLTTQQLAEVIAKANPKWEPHKHPATRSFQAVRIAVNNELEQLQSCLQQAIEVLKAGGRLAVISFHSLEDRLVKQFIQQQNQVAKLPRHLPLTAEQLGKYAAGLQAVGKAIKPSAEEIKSNPRSRSSILRIIEKM